MKAEAYCMLRWHHAECLSRWLDYWFQKLKPQITIYIKDSAQLLYKLKQIKQLPKRSWLFTVDAKSMYTNIDTNHAIEVISKWLDSLSLKKGFPLAAVKAAMKLAMRNNIFVWGDCNFLQLLGTAMVHPLHACGPLFIL